MNKVFTNLEDAFIYYTNCQVATMTDYLTRKAQSKSSIIRQMNITRGMIGEISAFPASKQRDAVIYRYQKALDDYGAITLPGGE